MSIKAIIFAVICVIIWASGFFLGISTSDLYIYSIFFPIIFSAILFATCALPLICAYFLKYKLHTLTVLLLTSTSILVMTYSFYSGFKDNFCWSKAQSSTYDKKQVATDLTENEREYIKKVYDIESPTIWLVTYMRCDKNFKFFEAFKKVYLEN